MRRVVMILLPVVAVIAVFGAAMGTWAKTSQPSDTALKHQISALRTAVANQDAKIALLKRGSQSGAVASMRSQLHIYKVCIPEIQQEISGMSIQQQTQGGYVTNAYIQNPTIISSDCTKALNG